MKILISGKNTWSIELEIILLTCNYFVEIIWSKLANFKDDVRTKYYVHTEGTLKH